MNFKNKDIREGKEVMPTFERKTMTVLADWNEDWFNSPYYDQLYSQQDEQEAGAFMNHLIHFIKPPPGSFMLECACGKGNYSQVLSSYGHDITGIDLSFNNIDEAKKMESEHVHFFQHDLRLPFWINYFHYAFSLFSRFGYYKSEREHYNAIRTIANSIRASGYFILDYLNVHYLEDNLVQETGIRINTVNFSLTKWYDEKHFYKKIVVEDDQLDKPLIYEEKVAKFSLGDFNDMLSFHHLQIQEVFGDYQFNSYHVKKSPRLVIIAKKR